jgi:hypothetical protein
MRRVIFIPWTFALEQVGDALQWQSSSILKLKWFDIVIYNQFLRPTFVRSMTEGSIYIFGHGCASSGNLWPSQGSESPLSFDRVADRLIYMGLQSTFAGKIKLFSCGSASGGDKSFASQFARYMREKKRYTSCTYEGYTTTLLAHMRFLLGGGLHKWEGDTRYLAYADRASATRVEV